MAKVVHLAEGVTIPHLDYYATDVEMVELNELFDGWARRHHVLDESERSKLGPQKVKFLAAVRKRAGYRSVHIKGFHSGHSSVWFTVENPFASLLAKARELDPSNSDLRVQPTKIEVELPWTRIEAVTQILDATPPASAPGSPLPGAQTAAMGFAAGATIGGAFTPGASAPEGGSASRVNDVDPMRFDEGT
ncbi:hypothetical protein ACWEK5_43195 [Rhodococcus koreensis]